MHPSLSQKTSCKFSSQGDAPWFCHFVLGLKLWNQISCPVWMFSRKLPLLAACLSNCNDISMCALLCYSISSCRTQRQQIFWYPTIIIIIIFCIALWPMPICTTISLTLWAHQFCACCILWCQFLVNLFEADWWCPCHHLWSVLPNAAHCQHPCNNFHRHDMRYNATNPHTKFSVTRISTVSKVIKIKWKQDLYYFTRQWYTHTS
jgi:hypothetical protein